MPRARESSTLSSSRPMATIHGWLIAAWMVVAVAACVTDDALHEAGAWQPPAPVDDVSGNVQQRRRVIEMEARETRRLAAEIRYLIDLQYLTEAELAQELSRLEALPRYRATPEDRLHLAWVLSLRDTPFQDLARAASLTQPLMPSGDPERTAIGDLATILHEIIDVQLTERRSRIRLRQQLGESRAAYRRALRQIERQQAQIEAQAARAIALRVEIEALSAKIDALTSIEKAISERESPE